METVHSDVLVLGGGAAGLRAALTAKLLCPELKVVVAAENPVDKGGSTGMVASEALGINAPFNLEKDGDSCEVYEADTIATGGGLSSPKLCRILAEESCNRLEELMEMGVVFASRDGVPVQQKLSGCTKARSLTCGGSTGRAILQALGERARALGVEIITGVRLTRLFKDSSGAVRGAWGRHKGRSLFMRSGAVVLATGGAAGMFSVCVTPKNQTGDGWAAAYDAGCRFVNMEFFQCGPAVAKPGMKFIIHSHMWRLLPRMTNNDGAEFLAGYCGDGVSAKEALELKAMSYPFSVRTAAKYVDIAIFKEIQAGRGTSNGGVWFDVTHVGKKELREKAPITCDTLMSAGIDITEKPMELGIAVQNFNGGIMIDENGFTGVEGLYAAGEVTGGVHGSDRPGGNNLTDTQVFGYRAGRAAAEYARQNRKSAFDPPALDEKLNMANEAADEDLIRQCEDIYYREMTIVRTKQGLERVLEFIETAEKKADGASLKNRLLTGKLLARAMLLRRESRGTHYRDDFPQTDSAAPERIILERGADGMPVRVLREEI